jgi:hypothetical protein
LSTTLHRLTQKHLCWHSITKILRNGPRAHFPFTSTAFALLAGWRAINAWRLASPHDDCALANAVEAIDISAWFYVSFLQFIFSSYISFLDYAAK